MVGVSIAIIVAFVMLAVFVAAAAYGYFQAMEQASRLPAARPSAWRKQPGRRRYGPDDQDC
jgi:hypothetical protein